jgi:hypothetical protein
LSSPLNGWGHDMFIPTERDLVIEKVDLLLAELAELRANGPHFRVVHRFCSQTAICAPGEEIFAIYFMYRGHEFLLRLPLALRMLFDYLARHSRLPQSAAQIEAGIRADPFYTYHATNVPGHRGFTRRIPRSFVRVYVERLRVALGNAFTCGGLSMNPRNVLVSEATVMNEKGYRLKASIEWTHIISSRQ